MKRDLYEKLTLWKASTRRKPLVLLGARQVGKTWLLRKFGENEYENTAYLNFEEDPGLAAIFSKELDPLMLIQKISAYQGIKIRKDLDLIIFDEIQLCNNALNSLKYFNEKANEFHIVCAGSTLGIQHSGDHSFPVGKVNFLSLFPLTFTEFLNGCDAKSLAEFVKTATLDEFVEPFSGKLFDHLKKYYFVGGMPESVKYFIESGDLNEVRKIQNEIIQGYRLDFSKHAEKKDIPKINEVWDSIPRQLAKENHKFVFQVIKESARGREYLDSIKWLEEAGFINRVFALKGVKLPLISYAKRNCFKVYVLDTGLLGAMVNLSAKAIIFGEDNYKDYKGAFVENYVAQQLRAQLDTQLFYWESSGNAEVDFVIQNDEEIVPLEVKAGINPKSKSLRVFQSKFSPPKLLRTTMLDYRNDGGIINIPLYAICRIADL
ncbi:ATP-binding protein [bacterium]|nr:ATP-binding protein [bacterium]